MKQLFQQTNFVAHQIDTYNDFIVNGLQAIIDREKPIECPTHTITFGHVNVDKPKFIFPDRTVGPLFPTEARKRNISYEGTIYVTIKITDGISSTEHTRISIGKIPIMLRSIVCNLTDHNRIANNECSNDFGGYFIIKGKERVLVGQLRRVYNRVFVEHKPEERYKHKYFSEIRSINDQLTSVLVQAKIDIEKNLLFSLPYIKNLLPAGLVFKALKISEFDMFKFIRIKDEKCIASLKNQYHLEPTAEKAIDFLSRGLGDDKDGHYVKTILENELFYHVGKLTNKKSAIHLALLLKKLVETVNGERSVDDKENLANKRLDTTAALISFLFQGLLKQFVRTISNQLKLKKNPEPLNIIKSIHNITHGLSMGFMTGNWNTQKSSSYTRVGVSQVLSMQNYGAKLSHLRRIMLPIGKKGKNPKARQLHSSHYSFICPFETPEGDTVGLLSNLALSAEASVTIPFSEVSIIVNEFKTFFKDDIDQKILIFLNGTIIGSCQVGIDFFREFETFRNSDLIDNHVSIVWLKPESEIHINSDEGRLLRPLFVIGKNNKLLYTDKSWKSAIAAGEIVFRDVWELEQSVVAMDKFDLMKNRCSYMEICPAATLMAVMASVIPFSNHSQSPRISYQSSMGKQAIGIPSEAYLSRYDTTLHIINTPQKPLTQSKLVNILHFDEMSHGAVPIVAIMTYCGFNQEDSIILNKHSLDRGLFAATTYKTIVEEERKRGNSDFETICTPKFEYRRREYDYSHLNSDGIPFKYNVWMKKGDVVIGKTINKMVKKKDEFGSRAPIRVLETSDASITIKHGEEGYLDSVLDTMTNDGVRVIKIRIRIPRKPEIGDKFASSTAQKGTCGMIYSQADMPFDKDGVVPDLIMNPHAIPSRMTINMLMEIAFNLVGCRTGKQFDATVFAHDDVEKELTIELQKQGWESYESTLYSGITGDAFPSKIFMGPAFYQRLKHMVADKIHARVTGPLDTLTHQPVAGRSRDGGLRFGEMERDCMLSHGSTRILKECLFDRSDKYVVPICTTCGNIPHTEHYCQTCEDINIEKKNMPYATKLFYQELQGMGVKLKIM